MRQTLCRVLLDHPWTLWKSAAAGDVPGIGIAWFWLAFGLGWIIWRLVRREGFSRSDRAIVLQWAAVGVAVTFLAPILPVASFPMFGYGFFLLVGFLVAVLFARRRVEQVGWDQSIVLDIGFWGLISGVVGARLFYLIQYGSKVFEDKSGLEALIAAVNLSQGGIVLYGGLIGGGIAYFTFCKVRGLDPLRLADVLTPSLFIGIGFGRIGCLMNGCCFGDVCELPWAITFPKESVPWESMVYRGILDETATRTLPLHPTQIYSSINGFVLAAVTATYFWHRRRDGDVFVLGCLLYPVTRFTIEFLRNDELGQFGTSLTISQWVSIGIFIAGLALMAFLRWRDPHGTRQVEAAGSGKSSPVPVGRLDKVTR